MVPTELRSHMNDSNRHLPMKCIKWNYGNIREIHKRRYVLRVCLCTCVCVCAGMHVHMTCLI